MNKENVVGAGQAANPVTVAVRVRPLSEKEKRVPDQEISLEFDEQHVSLPRHDANFCFDLVLGPEHTNQMLYDSIASPIVESALLGINGTIFAYGQTASGKTFSMQGDAKCPGILRLAALQIFEETAKPANENWKYSFVASYIEIYNERVKDLLTKQGGEDLKIREDRVLGFYAEGATERKVSSAKDILALFTEGEKRRHVAGTDMNLKSSRSHTIFIINMIATHQQVTTKSRLSLVDLAGSESVRQTNAEGDRLKEGAQINKSLLALSMVISSLSSGKKDIGHVGYRDSKLTQILRPSLSGNCKTAVLVCVSPAMSYAFETLSSLKFASSAKQIKTSYVVNRTHAANMRSYQDQIDQLTKSLQEEQEKNSAEQKAEELLAALKRKDLEWEEIAEANAQELESLAAQNNMLVESLAKLDMEREELLTERQGLIDNAQSLEDELKRNANTMAELEACIQALRVQSNALEQELSAAKRVMEEQELGWSDSKALAQEQAAQIASQAEELERLREDLEGRVADQLHELEEALAQQRMISKHQAVTMQEYTSELEQSTQQNQALQAELDVAQQREREQAERFASLQEELETKAREYEREIKRRDESSNKLSEISVEREDRLRQAFAQEKQALVMDLENKYMDSLQDVERAGMEREHEMQTKLDRALEEAQAKHASELERAMADARTEMEALRRELEQAVAQETGQSDELASTKQELADASAAAEEARNLASLLQAKVTVLEQDLVRAREGERQLEDVETERQALLTFRIESERIQQDLRARLEQERGEAKDLKAKLSMAESENHRLKYERERQRQQYEEERERLQTEQADNENLGLLQAQQEITRMKMAKQRLDCMFQEQTEELEQLRAVKIKLTERNERLEQIKMTNAIKEKMMELHARNKQLEKENKLLKAGTPQLDEENKLVKAAPAATACAVRPQHELQHDAIASSSSTTSKRRVPLTPL